MKTQLLLTPFGSDMIQNFFGTNYNYGFFQYHACNFCDDIVAECADISVGDACLSEYLPGGRGTSVNIIRRKEIARLIKRAITKKRLAIHTQSPKLVVESQTGGFRLRR